LLVKHPPRDTSLPRWPKHNRTMLEASMDDKSGTLPRTVEGQFIAGVSGNPNGRPKGSKNRITLLKMATEEAWRERNQDRLDAVLDLILADALDGDKGARKMVFDAIVSKANVAEDKAAGERQTIKVHKMIVNKGDQPSDTGEEDAE